MSAKPLLMIYGATGYTGRRIARLARERGVRVVLAGRSESRVAEFASELEFPYRAFALETPEQREQRLRSQRLTSSRDRRALSPNHRLDAALADVAVLINAASPFSETALPLARACIRTRAHYVDICGEYEVFRMLDDLHVPAKSAGVFVIPGAGLTVLGSDVLVAQAAALLRTKAARPHFVRVALSRVPVISRGSARTMLDSVRDGLLVRRNGELQVTPVGAQVRGFAFDAPRGAERPEPRLCLGLTLADISSAARTASQYALKLDGPPLERDALVPNVETYVEASSLERAVYEVSGNFALALRTSWVKRALNGVLGLWPEGPLEHERDGSKQQIVVEVEDAYRRMALARLETSNSYDFTAAAALRLACMIREMPSSQRRGGFASPAQAFHPGELLTADMANTQVELWGFDTRENARVKRS